MHGQQNIKVSCVDRDRLQSESLNFTQDDGRGTTLTGHRNLQRRQLLEYEQSVLICASNGLPYPVAYSVTGLYGSTRIETNI
jgi:hypothetical protein